MTSTTTKNITICAGVIALLVAIFLLNGGTRVVTKTVLSLALPLDYFEELPTQLKQITANVYHFQYGINRGMVLETSNGVAVFDTFNPAYARALETELRANFPNKEVRWVVYSHNHLDHIRGSDVFGSADIIGHERVNELIADWPHANDTRRVTHPLPGDAVLSLGGIDVHFLFMGQSHSLTLFGIHIPIESVVFAPDMLFVKTMPPFDFPDFYYPGYVRALDRLIELNAQHYIPSHFGEGGHKDLVDYRNMTVAFQETIASKLAGYDYYAGQGHVMRKSIKEAYDELGIEYGDWHGFDAMFVPKFGRHWGGTYLGY